MRLRVLGLVLITLLIVILSPSGISASRDETLLYVGWTGLVGGSTATLVYNSIGPPNRGWIGVGSMLGIVNLPIGIAIIGLSIRDESTGFIGLGAGHLFLGGLNLMAAWDARESLDKKVNKQEDSRLRIELGLASTNPSVRASLRW